jgi:hypothetical protein
MGSVVVDEAATVIGVIVVIIGLIGFVRSIWKLPGRPTEHADTSMPGLQVDTTSHHAGMDGHGGGDAGH